MSSSTMRSATITEDGAIQSKKVYASVVASQNERGYVPSFKGLDANAAGGVNTSRPINPIVPIDLVK